MEQQLKELHDLKSYLGLKLAQHIAAGGNTHDPFVRSVWDLHGELATALEEVEQRLDEGANVAMETETESNTEESSAPTPDEASNFAYLRWLLEAETV